MEASHCLAGTRCGRARFRGLHHTHAHTQTVKLSERLLDEHLKKSVLLESNSRNRTDRTGGFAVALHVHTHGGAMLRSDDDANRSRTGDEADDGHRLVMTFKCLEIGELFKSGERQRPFKRGLHSESVVARSQCAL